MSESGQTLKKMMKGWEEGGGRMKLLAEYTLALIDRSGGSIWIKECHKWFPVSDDVLEDCKVYRNDRSFVIEGTRREYLLNFRGEAPGSRYDGDEDFWSDDAFEKYYVKEHIFWGKRIERERLRSGWLPTKNTKKVRIEVYGTLILEE